MAVLQSPSLVVEFFGNSRHGEERSPLTRSPRTLLDWKVGLFTVVNRYFSATAMGGRLYVQGVPDRGPWNSAWLVYYPEEMVEKIVQPLAGDRKARTTEELAEAIRVSWRGLPTITVWISEEMEEMAKMCWEESRSGKKRIG